LSGPRSRYGNRITSHRTRSGFGDVVVTCTSRSFSSDDAAVVTGRQRVHLRSGEPRRPHVVLGALGEQHRPIHELERRLATRPQRHLHVEHVGAVRRRHDAGHRRRRQRLHVGVEHGQQLTLHQEQRQLQHGRGHRRRRAALVDGEVVQVDVLRARREPHLARRLPPPHHRRRVQRRPEVVRVVHRPGARLPGVEEQRRAHQR